ncbi:hypothetical protein DGI_3318 [Megalodesulfovibrio gigas DSM 1382 = ATCC 19364]|uniref:Uncharacterized protein n=1 Tax=Megalodesulfovibrio gigas (strain ATCC 19364 / DSM 1382 / NCIMB 9332 / VKM B-1759) TaxID=1121448 RepID=T2GFE4_MEGG1|nr:hypothetical protein DGI_3318 [Megalodesulfovibrio gigas DSM 1382 = ATCC 19364]
MCPQPQRDAFRREFICLINAFIVKRNSPGERQLRIAVCQKKPDAVVWSENPVQSRRKPIFLYNTVQCMLLIACAAATTDVLKDLVAATIGAMHTIASLSIIGGHSHGVITTGAVAAGGRRMKGYYQRTCRLGQIDLIGLKYRLRFPSFAQ